MFITELNHCTVPLKHNIVSQVKIHTYTSRPKESIPLDLVQLFALT